MPALAVVSMRH